MGRNLDKADLRGAQVLAPLLKSPAITNGLRPDHIYKEIGFQTWTWGGVLGYIGDWEKFPVNWAFLLQGRDKFNVSCLVFGDKRGQ
ncbi:hypothetical protein X474_21175 [Dethiosulfatarculus sandiegensis]|uniref:Uncharacterized protein n=1 Tax=Dethiosulfatarculus sandiegensis TaxID=1429043 RepID=A0A0D2JRD5_9BACT|nr:hypothetical protein X474_21175 [Dethiosulfatarculus sandiegensis]